MKNQGLKKSVVTVSGGVTSHLRSRWGLAKHRDDTYLHHLMDAIVVGCTDSGMVQRVANYHKAKERSNTKKQHSLSHGMDSEMMFFLV